MFAETLAGIALVKSAVDGIKSAISTARDVGEIADELDKLFTGEQQIQKKKQKRSSAPFSVGSLARETIDAKIAAEHRQEIATLIDLRFGHGTWQGIINERAKRLREHQEAERLQRLAKEKQQEELMIGAAVILGLLIVTGVFAFLYIRYG
tara:strand:+ start:113 stop:565 length:453 start_codon:yes stop_codon:yes gene_type:complete